MISEHFRFIFSVLLSSLFSCIFASSALAKPRLSCDSLMDIPEAAFAISRALGVRGFMGPSKELDRLTRVPESNRRLLERGISEWGISVFPVGSAEQAIEHFRRVKELSHIGVYLVVKAEPSELDLWRIYEGLLNSSAKFAAKDGLSSSLGNEILDRNFAAKQFNQLFEVYRRLVERSSVLQSTAGNEGASAHSAEMLKSTEELLLEMQSLDTNRIFQRAIFSYMARSGDLIEISPGSSGPVVRKLTRLETLQLLQPEEPGVSLTVKFVYQGLQFWRTGYTRPVPLNLSDRN